MIHRTINTKSTARRQRHVVTSSGKPLPLTARQRSTSWRVAVPSLRQPASPKQERDDGYLDEHGRFVRHLSFLCYTGAEGACGTPVTGGLTRRLRLGEGLAPRRWQRRERQRRGAVVEAALILIAGAERRCGWGRPRKSVALDMQGSERGAGKRPADGWRNCS